MKEAYYFPHDANARTDAKILELRAEFGWEGYGLWWALVEQLREASEYRLSNTLIGGLAMGLAIEKPKLRTLLDLCISVGLLVVEGDCFYSPSLRRRMVALDNKRLARVESARNAAEKRWQSAGNASAMRTHSEGNADAMRNDATLEESTVDLTKPNLTEEDTTSSFQSEVDAASAAGEPEKKIRLGEKFFTDLAEKARAAKEELRTPGGAADVGTRVGDGQKGQEGQDCGQTDKPAAKKSRRSKDKADKPRPGSADAADYQMPDWATTSFVEEFAAWLARRQTRSDCKPLTAPAVQARLNELGRYDEAFCSGLFRQAEQNPHWQGLTFDNTPHKFTQHVLQLQKLQQDANRINQPERGAKPTEAASYGARALSAQLRAIREERSAQNGSYVHPGAAAGTHAGLGSPVPPGVGAPQGG